MKPLVLFLFFTLSLSAQVRIACGSSSPITDSAGNVWSADTQTQGTQFSTSAHITGTPNPALFVNDRWGTMTYTIPVPAGNYNLNLLFADPSRTPGERQFSVVVNGTPWLTNFDVSQTAGGENIAITQTVAASSVGGNIVIDFQPGTTVPPPSDPAPFCNAIDIEPATPPPPPIIGYGYVVYQVAAPTAPGPCPASTLATASTMGSRFMAVDSLFNLYFCVPDATGNFHWGRVGPLNFTWTPGQ